MDACKWRTQECPTSLIRNQIVTMMNISIELCFTYQKAQKEIYWVEPTPLQVSSYTHLLYKAQDPFSARRQSQVQNNFLSETILMKDQSLLHRSRNSGRDLLGGTNSFAGQLLHPSPVQSSRSIQCMQTVPGSKQFSV